MDHRRKKLQGSLAAARRDKPIARPRKLRTHFGFPWDELGVDVSSMGVIDQDKKKKPKTSTKYLFLKLNTDLPYPWSTKWQRRYGGMQEKWQGIKLLRAGWHHSCWCNWMILLGPFTAVWRWLIFHKDGRNHAMTCSAKSDEVQLLSKVKILF